MKRADPDKHSGKQHLNAFAHDACCLVRKRDRQDFPGVNPLFDQAGDSASDDPCLPGARSGDDEQRSFKMLNRRSLGGGQIIDNVHETGTPL